MAKVTKSTAAPVRVKATKQVKADTAETETDSEDEDEAEDRDGDEADQDGDSEADTGEQDQEGADDAPEGETPASDSPKAAGKAPEQLGFAKRSGHTSTKPEKPKSLQRPYLDSPKPFGIHVKGHLVRFEKGRTLINNHTHRAPEVTGAVLLEALKTDSYVEDNGAEVVE